MSNSGSDKPLPQPPTRPFGRKRSFGEPEPQEQLTADRMAQAAAEGKLDEFMQQEMPDNDYARNLAAMVLGMTGMLPAGAMPASPEQPKAQEAPAAAPEPSVEVPDDVRQAIMSGDLQGLMEKLRREHAKRNPGSAQEAEPMPSAEAAPPQGMPTVDKKLIDALVLIAQENSVSLDWIILRAIKVYVQEYEKSGKL